MIFTGFFEADHQLSMKKPLSPNIERNHTKSGQKIMRTRQNSGKRLSAESKNNL
jgi:hypothetical protein